MIKFVAGIILVLGFFSAHADPVFEGSPYDARDYNAHEVWFKCSPINGAEILVTRLGLIKLIYPDGRMQTLETTKFGGGWAGTNYITDDHLWIFKARLTDSRITDVNDVKLASCQSVPRS